MEIFKLVLGVAIFIVTFYYIISEKYPKSLVAIIGGSLMVVSGILNEEEALETIGYNLEVIFLLVGMMMIVEIMSDTGVFQWVAIKIAQVAKGDPTKILIFISVVTALFSAMLDNVTTILLVVPVTIFLAKRLEVDPEPFVLLQIFMSNIGGTATMIGDPPNLIIASLGNIGFNDFIINLAPLILINTVVLLGSASLYFKKKLTVSRELKMSIMELDLGRTIKDKKLLVQSLALFSIVIIGFLTNSVTNIGLAVIALFGSIVLIFVSKKKPEEIFAKIEWETLFFFGGLFVLVEGVDKLGIISKIGELLVEFTDGDLELTSSVVVVLSAILSPILGSVPYTLSFSKIIASIVPDFVGNTDVLWWALSLGACLGGNMTMVGAPANIVGVSIAGKADVHISFMDFFKYGILVVAESVILSIIYINLRY